MALSLDTLTFVVDSSQLDEARIKIAKLGDAVGALNKPLQDMARSSAKTNEVIAKSELASEKARVATKALADSTGKVAEEIDPLTKLITKLSNQYTDMASGFTKGESSILNQARSMGVFGAELHPIISLLEKIKTLNKDPFDASLGGVRSITQEFEKLQQRANLAAQGIMLTTKQLGEYSKLAAEAAGKVEGMGFDPKQGEGLAKYNQLLADSQNKYLETVASVNKLTQAEKDRNAALKQQEQVLASNKAISDAMIKETAGQVGQKSPELKQMAEFYKKQAAEADKLTKAQNLLAASEERLRFVNEQLAAGLTTASANALLKYKQQLEQVGTSSDLVAKKMQAFKEQLVVRQGYSPIKKLADDTADVNKRLDHLSRALGPQITDIFVGLATGQDLLTVALQQGGQIRDQIALAGVESSKMGKALTNSMLTMVSSIKDVSVAFGQLFLGAIVAAGKGFTDFITKITFTKSSIDNLSKSFPEIAKSANIAIGSIAALGAVLSVVVLSAMFKNQSQMDTLTRSLVLTGGSMDLTATKALVMAESMNKAGIGTSKALEVMTAMAKQGGFTASEIEMVTKSAVELQKYGGVAIEDSIKTFAKMREKPVEALIEVGKSTGFVSLETIKLVKSLEDQGKYAEATTIAMKAKADADEEAIRRIKNELTPLALLWIDVKDLIGQAMTAVYNFANSSSSVAGFRTVFETVAVIVAEVWYTIKQVGNEIGGVAAQIAAVISGDFSGALEIHKQMQTDAVTARQAQDELIASILNRNKAQSEGVKISNAQAAANSKEISDYVRGTKAREEAEAKAKKAAEDLRKQKEKDIETYKDLMNVYTGYTKTYNNQVESLKRLLSSKEISPDKFKEAMFALEQLQPYFKMSEDAFAKYNEEIEKHDKVIKDLQDTNSAEASSLEHRASLLGKTAEEQRKLTIEYEKNQKLLKLEVQYQKELAELEKRGFDGQYGTNKRSELDKQFADARVLIETDANLKIAEDYMKKFEALQKELGDVMFLALTNRGAQAGKKLRDLIQAELMKPINVVINAVIGDILGSLGLNSGKAGSSGILGAVNTGSSLLNIYNTVSAGFAGLASSVGGMISSVGSATGLSSLSSFGAGMKGATLAPGLAGPTTAGATGATGAGASVGSAVATYGPYILAAYVALDQLGILDRWSGDPDAFLVQGTAGQTNPYQTSANTAFGQIGFANGNALINKGGRFIREKGETEGVSAAFQQGVLDVFKNLDAEIARTLSQGQIAAVSKQLEGWYRKSWSFSGSMIDDWIAARYEVILKTIDPKFTKLKDFQKEGEKLTDTVVRLIGNFQAIKTIFEDLGFTTTNITYSLADAYVSAFGSLQNFVSASNSYYDNFYSESEKIARTTSMLTEVFSSLGYELPTTKEAFRAIVDAVQATGDPTKLATLFGIQQAFSDLVDTGNKAREAFKALTDSLLEEINRLRGAILGDAGVSGNVSGLSAEFAILTAQARAGSTTAIEKLPEYSQAIEQAVAASAVNAADVAYARAWLAESLGATSNVLTGVEPSAGSTFTQDVATPSTVNGATALTASTSSQADMIAALVAEVQGLRAEVRADVAANNKTAKILERANQDGETISVTVAA